MEAYCQVKLSGTHKEAKQLCRSSNGCSASSSLRLPKHGDAQLY